MALDARSKDCRGRATESIFSAYSQTIVLLEARTNRLDKVSRIGAEAEPRVSALSNAGAVQDAEQHVIEAALPRQPLSFEQQRPSHAATAELLAAEPHPERANGAPLMREA